VATLALVLPAYGSALFQFSPPQPPTSGSQFPEQWFTQRLDHFHLADNQTWQQRYWRNFEHYKEGGPTFIMIGGEGAASPGRLSSGVWTRFAKEQGAALFILEHRFYGNSTPTSDLSTENLVYLNSQQALADLAQFIESKKQEHNLTGPWIAFGGSYAGSLAAWLRYRYPHLVAGAASSSGPLLAKANFHEYYEVVMSAMDFTGMPQCNPAISAAIADIDQLIATEEGSARLIELFNLCKGFDFHNIKDVHRIYVSVMSKLAGIVQYDNDIDTFCKLMTNEDSGTPLERLAQLYTLKKGDECHTIQYSSFLEKLRSTNYIPTGIGSRQWYYQKCTEFGWFQTSDQEGHPYGNGFPIESMEQICTDVFGADFGHKMVARSVAATNIEYGGKNLDVDKVVFVQGSIDPWHAMGVTEDLSDDAPAIFINGTSHCADMYNDKDGDPLELIEARLRIGELVDQWIKDAKV